MDKATQVKLKIDFDPDNVRQRIDVDKSRAQKILDARILQDSNFYCPMKNGILQKSGIAHTVIGSGRIIWQTPYARRQYYGESFDHSEGRNINARAKWFEAAKAKNLKLWVDIANGEFN